MKKVLITGSEGFTGRYMIQFLERLADIEIVGIDLIASKRIRTFQIDVLDQKETARVIEKEKPDFIIHLAGINRSDDYSHFYKYNLFSVINILEAVREHNLSETRMLFISSSAVYGKVISNPVKESDATSPVNFYGSSKLAMETAILQYYQNFSLKVNIVRPFNLIGPGQNTSFVIPYFIEKIAGFKAKPSLAVIKTKNLASSRDFVDVRDAVDAYWRVVIGGKPGEIYNIASGKAIGVRDLLNKIINLIGPEKEIQIEEGRAQPGEIPIIIGDTAKIAALQWSIKIKIEETLKDIILAYQP